MTVLPSSWRGAPDQPLLVLSNSLGTVQSMWDELMPWIEGRFRVLTYDLPGHFGPSPPFTFRDMVSRTIALLDGRGLSGVLFAGVSVGGAIAIATAAARPDLISGVVAVNAPIRQASPQFWLDRADAVDRGGLGSIAESLSDRWFPEATPAAQRIIDDFAGLDANGYAAACRALADLDIAADAAALSVPTLIVSAADDASVPMSNSTELAEIIPTAVLTRVEDGGHLLPVRRPDIVGPLISAFADERPQ